MTTRTPTSRDIEVPVLEGIPADQAIQQLRALGLMPMTLPSAVDDVRDAGFVIGVDPPQGSPVRRKTSVTISVATHPDFEGHADETLAAQQSGRSVQPPLTWPRSSPTGFSPRDAAEAAPTAAAPIAPAAPASSSPDAATREIPQPDAGSSSAAEPTHGAAADPYAYDVSAPVPTPDEISAATEWDRRRAAEAARHAAEHTPSHELPAPPVVSAPGDDSDAAAALTTADALEEKARRDARRRSARRRGRLTFKQKLIVGAVLALTVLIGLSAMSAHKPAAHPQRTARTAAHHPARSSHKSGTTAGHHAQTRATEPRAHHQRDKARTHRVVTAREHHRSHAIQRHASAPTTSHTSATAPIAPVSPAPSDTTPASTGAGAPPTTTTPASTAPATASHKPASDPSSADSHSSGSGGGSTLQSPDGTTAPPKP